MDQKTLDFMKARLERAIILRNQIEKYSNTIKDLKKEELSILSVRIGEIDLRKGPSKRTVFEEEDQKVLRSMRESLRRSLEKELKRLQREWDEL